MYIKLNELKEGFMMNTDEQKTGSYDVMVAESLNGILDTMKDIQVFKPQEVMFLVEHKEHLAKVFANVHMWRTDSQKRSIISDDYHPTLHSKFHQAMCEQKVQCDQAFYLAKDFELKKLEIEELVCDIEELSKSESKRDDIKRRKAEIEAQFKKYELKQIQIAMNYRMSEVMGWQVLEEELLERMRAEGMDDDSIWSKNAGEVESMFFMFLTNLQGLKNSTDGAEANNLVSLARFGIKQAKEAGIFHKLIARCDSRQLDSLAMLGEIKLTPKENPKVVV